MTVQDPLHARVRTHEEYPHMSVTPSQVNGINDLTVTLGVTVRDGRHASAA